MARTGPLGALSAVWDSFIDTDAPWASGAYFFAFAIAGLVWLGLYWWIAVPVVAWYAIWWGVTHPRLPTIWEAAAGWLLLIATPLIGVGYGLFWVYSKFIETVNHGGPDA